MFSVAALAVPFFALILIGYGCGKLLNRPEAGLDWMNFFIVYVALPALFYKLIASTPFEQLSNVRYVVGTTLSTLTAFALALCVGMVATRAGLRAASIQAALGSYANVGYMGPGLTMVALGPDASVPTALIFVFDCALMFTLVPFLMALSSSGSLRLWDVARTVVVKVATHPFNIATSVGVLAAYFRVELPAPIDTTVTYLRNAAAPCALFVLGVTVALRPIRSVPAEIPVQLAIKLVLHPLIVWAMLSALGPFDPVWVYTAILMASLPPALNVFVMARQYDVYVERASTGILLGTVASVATVTGMLILIGARLLPPDLFSLRVR